MRYEPDMTEQVLIRPADERDIEFVAGLVSSLLEFGSPAWNDPAALAPELRDVLAGAVGVQESRSTVLIAQRTDGTDGRPVERTDRHLSGGDLLLRDSQFGCSLLQELGAIAQDALGLMTSAVSCAASETSVSRISSWPTPAARQT